MKKLNKMWPAATTTLVAITTVLISGILQAEETIYDDGVCTLEGPSCGEGCLNLPARPQVQCGYNLFIEADLLWWSMYEYGLEYAIDAKNITSITSNINKGETVGPGNDYSWAFRFSVGYNLPHDGWDLRGNWTFFNNSVSDHVRPAHNGGLYPIFMTPDQDLLPVTTNGYVEKAGTKWEVELNIIDFELGRAFFTSKFLSLRPHIGLRYTRLDQTYHLHYDGGNLLDRQERCISSNSNDFWGFGLRSGFNTEWELSNGFGVYGNFAYALLHGHFHISQDEYIRNKNSRQRIDRLDFNNRKCVGRATADIAFGLRWDHMFEGDRFHLGLKLGWEHHMFFGQNQMWKMMNSYQPAIHSKGNDELTTQGWTFSARFDF